MIEDTFGTLASVQAMYERWVAEVRKESADIGGRLPGWSDLNADQTLDWMAAYGATIEVAHRMARATGRLVTEAMGG